MVAVVLAAGTGSRFGAGTKPLAELEGRPLLAHVVGAAVAAEVSSVHVVVGHDGDAVAAAARAAGDVEVVVNPDHAEGQATSLLAGLASADTSGAEVVVVLLADEPDVSPAAITAVARAVGSRGAEAARARYDDGVGHPVALARRLLPRLRREVRGDRGARDVLAWLEVEEVPVPGPRPADLDRPEDLAERARGEVRRGRR